MIYAVGVCIAYIDAANLSKATEKMGWRIDYVRFRKWLSDVYKISEAKIFIGMIPRLQYVYSKIERAGFTIVYKETIQNEEGNIKGNCDAEIITTLMSDYYENKFSKAIMVTSDGDFACVCRFLNKKNALLAIVSPSDKCSIFLKRISVPITFCSTQRNLIQLESQKGR